jgi:hypothetical protein
MPHSGSLTPADPVGKLDYLRVACDKCGRAGHYGVHRLIETHGRDGKITDWLAGITADCPRRKSNSRSGANTPFISLLDVIYCVLSSAMAFLAKSSVSASSVCHQISNCGGLPGKWPAM